MNDRAYDEGVRDGIRSGNPGLHELSKQIADLSSKLKAVEEALERDRGPGVVGTEGSHEEYAVREALAILSESANAGAVPSTETTGGEAEERVYPTPGRRVKVVVAR